MKNSNREYNFKYWHYIWVGIVVLPIAFALSIPIFVDILEPAIRQMPLDSNLRTAISIIFFIIMIYLSFLVTTLSESKGRAIMYKSHFELELKNKRYSIRYDEIKNVALVNLVWDIFLRDGTAVRIGIPLRPRFRSSLSKFMKELRSEVETRNPPKKRSRKG